MGWGAVEVPCPQKARAQDENESGERVIGSSLEVTELGGPPRKAVPTAARVTDLKIGHYKRQEAREYRVC